MLKPFGFELREAENGREAFEAWRDWMPDMIWMDIKMPVMDGFEAIKKIREIEDSRIVPPENAKSRTVIIAITASAFEDERAAVVMSGCDDFMRKPFRDSDFFEMIRKHLGIRFVYENNGPADRPERGHDKCAAPASELVADIPGDLLKKLEVSAGIGDIEEIDGLVEEIRKTHPKLAGIFASFSYDFRFDKIIQMIRDANCLDKTG